MPSPVDIAKRKLIKVLKELGAKYRINLNVTIDSGNSDVAKAFRKVSLMARPSVMEGCTDALGSSARPSRSTGQVTQRGWGSCEADGKLGVGTLVGDSMPKSRGGNTFFPSKIHKRKGVDPKCLRCIFGAQAGIPLGKL